MIKYLRRPVVLVTILGIFFRFYLMAGFGNPCCGSDEATYTQLASHIIKDHQFVITPRDDPGLNYPMYGAKPPLYPYFLAALFSVVGVDSPLAKVAQVLLAAVTGLLLYRIGSKLFSKRAGASALIIYTFFWEVAFTSQTFLSENLYWFLSALLLYLCIKAKTVNLWFVGVIVGLLTLLRPPSLLFLLPVLWLVANSDRRHKLMQMLLVIVCAFVTVLPWSIRNFLVFHQFVFVYTDGGINLWMGNYQDTGGGYNVPRANFPNEVPHLHSKGAARETERDYFYYQQSKAYIIHHPLRVMDLAIAKTALTFLPWRPPINNTTGQRQKWALAPPVSDGASEALVYLVTMEFAALQIMFVLGIWMLWKMRRLNKTAVFVLAVFGLNLLTILMTHAETRYAMQLFIPMMLFAGFTLAMLFNT